MEIEGLRIRFLAGNPALAADLSTLFREIEQTSGNAIGAIFRLLNKFSPKPLSLHPNAPPEPDLLTTRMLASRAGEFAGTLSADRLVLTVGRFNKYANNPKTDFLNWTAIMPALRLRRRCSVTHRSSANSPRDGR
jgi:hypothetical protein